MKKAILFLIFLTLNSCHHDTDILPLGVSTFISNEDFKSNLGFYFTPVSMDFDPQGNLFVADLYRILKIDSNGNMYLYAGGQSGFKNGKIPNVLFNQIQSISFNSSGDLYITELGNHCIRKIDPFGEVTLFSGKINWSFLPGAENIPDGPDSSAHFIDPNALAIDFLGNLYITESGFINRYSSDAVRKIKPNGYVETIAGHTGELYFGSFNNEPNTNSDLASRVTNRSSCVTNVRKAS